MQSRYSSRLATTCQCNNTRGVFAGCVFRGLRGGSGAGISLETKRSREEMPTSAALFGCVFEDNFALMKGAGVYMEPHSSLLLSQCMFEGNQAPTGPEIAAEGTSSSVYTDTAITIAMVTHSDRGFGVTEDDLQQDALMLQSLPLSQAPASLFLAGDDPIVVGLEEVFLPAPIPHSSQEHLIQAWNATLK
jgi:hypothetical protein